MISAINHTAESRRVIARAEEALAADDLPRASALIWDSAACAMRSIAETRGWERESVEDLMLASRKSADEIGEPDIHALFQIAWVTPYNAMEGWLSEEAVAENLKGVKRFLAMTESLATE